MRSLYHLLAGIFSVAFVAHACIQEPAKKPKATPQNPKGAVLRWQSRADQNGRIPADALPRELAAHQRRLALMPQALSGPSNWTLLGPGNIGGRVRSILIHPTNPSTMWVGSVSGGVWKTTTAGSSWTMLPDLPAVIAVRSE